MLIYGSAALAPDDLLVRDRLANGLKNIWDTSGLLASGFEYKDATMAGVVLVAPKSLLDKAAADVFESLIKQIRDVTSTSGIYTGLFECSDEESPRLYTMLGGLPFPARLRAVLNQAKEEGPELGHKVARPIEELELGELEGLDLFAAGLPGETDPGTGSVSSDEVTNVARKLSEL